jgi:hypothetical protein
MKASPAEGKYDLAFDLNAPGVVLDGTSNLLGIFGASEMCACVCVCVRACVREPTPLYPYARVDHVSLVVGVGGAYGSSATPCGWHSASTSSVEYHPPTYDTWLL